VVYAGRTIAHREEIASMKRKPLAKKHETEIAVRAKPEVLLSDVRELILQAREGVARAIDSGLTTLYWHVGCRIRQDILKEKRAEYGQKIVSALGTQLTAEFGAGFTRRNLFNMVRFAEVFPDAKIVHALRAQLGWTHFRRIIYLDDPLKRDFYAEMCRMENWNTRTLEKQIGAMLFERTAISKKPDKLIRQELKQLREEDKLTPDFVFRDPYVLDFLGLKTPTRRRISRRQSCARLKPSSWSWGAASALSNVKNGCRLMIGTTISICCSTIANCVGWWPST
jgi:uncharacterized protein DUF1016